MKTILIKSVFNSITLDTFQSYKTIISIHISGSVWLVVVVVDIYLFFCYSGWWWNFCSHQNTKILICLKATPIISICIYTNEVKENRNNKFLTKSHTVNQISSCLCCYQHILIKLVCVLMLMAFAFFMTLFIDFYFSVSEQRKIFMRNGQN